MSKDDLQKRQDEGQSDLGWMNESLAKSLSALNAFLAWIVIGAFVVAGILIGEEWSPGYGWIVGVLVGLIVGWLVAVVLFGTLAVLLNMRALLEHIRDLLKEGNAKEEQHGGTN